MNTQGFPECFSIVNIVIINIEEGNGKPLKYSCLEDPMNSMKRQKHMTLKAELPDWWVPNMLPEMSGEITPERMKRWSQSENKAQLWM